MGPERMTTNKLDHIGTSVSVSHMVSNHSDCRLASNFSNLFPISPVATSHPEPYHCLAVFQGVFEPAFPLVVTR